MEKRPVKFDLVEWMILTDLIKARPKKYQDKDHKGSNLYNLKKLNGGCGVRVGLSGEAGRAQYVLLVTKLEGYIGEGHRYIEFRPFDDEGDATG